MYHIASDSREEKGINVEDGVAVISFRCNGLRVNPNKQQAGDSPAEQLEGGAFFRICNQCCSSVFCSLIIRARLKKKKAEQIIVANSFMAVSGVNAKL